MKKDPLAIFRTHSTGVILNYVDKHQHTQYEDFLKFCTPYALNRILKELQNRGFITCFYNVELVIIELN